MELRSLLLSRGPKDILARYVLALLATGLSLACRAALDPVLGTYVPYLAIFPAVVFSAWYCGLWPSVASVVVAFLGESYWFIEPRHTMTISHAAVTIGAFVYLIAAVFIIMVAESSRRSMAEAKALHQKLDDLVKERTAELEARNAELMDQTEVVRSLSSRLLTLQDEERRHIARELHDSAGQLAAVMKMNLTKMAAQSRTLPEPFGVALAESMSVLDQLIGEIRTISYLLHPPLLDALGLESALKWFVEGFGQRSKIQVKLQLSAEDIRLPAELETHLFRAVQECLTNIYRHSGSPTARLGLSIENDRVRLEVADNGKGIPPEKLKALESKGQLGVGIAGMRERVRQFGGTLDIKSDATGTVVVISVPITAHQRHRSRESESPALRGLKTDAASTRAASVGTNPIA